MLNILYNTLYCLEFNVSYAHQSWSIDQKYSKNIKILIYYYNLK